MSVGRLGGQHEPPRRSLYGARLTGRVGPVLAGVLVFSCALLSARALAAATVSPLPRSDYAVHEVCAAPALGRAGCLSLQLVPRTKAAHAHTHPLGVARAVSGAAPSPAAGDYGLRPQDLHSAYQLPGTAASAQTIAVVDSYNDPNAESDLGAYDEEFGLPACTAGNGCFKQVNQSGETGNLPFPKTVKELETARKGTKAAREQAEEATGWGVEISLDIEVAHATCQNCRIVLLEATVPSFEDLEKAESTAAALGAGEISNSWGGSEDGETPALEGSSPFNRAGVVITASSGDDGYLGWDAPSSLERGYVDYPASSPHVVAVGGTRLSLAAGGAWAGETVWDGDGAGGGGCSIVFTAQPWQQAVADWSAVGCAAKRAVADVAADADPYTGVAVRDTSPACEFRYEEAKVKHVANWCTIGGTSLASPLIASVFALAGGADGISYPAATLYENELRSPGSLHDVTAGSNGECRAPFTETGLSGCTAAEEAQKSCASRLICLAAAGYDGPTGVGTPDGISAFAPAPTATAPTVLTGTAFGISRTVAAMAATVNPNGAKVGECRFEWGTTPAYGSSVPCSPSPGSGSSPVEVRAELKTLTANTTYHFRIVAANAGGTSDGEDQSFTTLPNPPAVVTGSASAISTGAATLGASVTPEGREVSACSFEYGTTPSYGSSVACSPSPGSGTSPVQVAGSLSGLAAGATYHYRVVATNAGGTGRGADAMFATPSLLSITTAALPEGDVGSGYFEPLAAVGGTPPYTWSLAGGALPAGLHLNAQSGAIVGTPEAAGTSSFTVQASDSGAPAPQTSTASLSITVGPAVEQMAEYGRCVPQKKGTYSDGNCQTVAEKKGRPDHKGGFEWAPGPAPACVAQKKGEYTSSSCTTRSAKPRKGGFELAPGPAFTSTLGTITLQAPELGATVVCAGGTGAGEVTGVRTGVLRLTFTGCEASGRKCTSEGPNSTPSGTPGTIVTNRLGTRLIGPVLGQVWSELASSEHEPYSLEFGCEGDLLRTVGSLVGVQSGDVDVSSATSTTTFALGQGEQSLFTELSQDGGASWLGPDASSEVATASNTAAAAIEIKA